MVAKITVDRGLGLARIWVHDAEGMAMLVEGPEPLVEQVLEKLNAALQLLEGD